MADSEVSCYWNVRNDNGGLAGTVSSLLGSSEAFTFFS